MPSRCFLTLSCIVLTVVILASAHAGHISNALVRIEYPDIGNAGAVRIYHRNHLVSGDNWYFLVTAGMWQPGERFRSRGRVVKVDIIKLKDGGARLKLVRLTDNPVEPDIGTFEITYELRGNRSIIWHSMVFTPKRIMCLRSCEFFVTTEKPMHRTHTFHFFESKWRIGVRPAKSTAPYGRIWFPFRHTWLALSNNRTGLIIALGAPSVDVKQFGYSIEFKRFELSRAGGVISPDKPLREFAWLGFGKDVATLAEEHKVFERTVKREPRTGEIQPPIPSLSKAPPERKFGVRVDDGEGMWCLSADDFRLWLDARTGALIQWETAKGKWLSSPGGINYMLWAQQKSIGPRGGVQGVQINRKSISFKWYADELTAQHRITVHDGYVLWRVTVPNMTGEILLLEVRLSLPVQLGEHRWFYWDGQSLHSVNSEMRNAELTTLVPGGTFSQGIFPAVCLHDRVVGFAIGLEPMDIESFYGSRMRPALGALETFYYVVRMAIPPRTKRRVTFVLFAIDPNWSWRSLIDRYWSFFPEVFAPPKRQDIWGLYASASPMKVHRLGDKFIELCRRMRVGGMELYAPFNKTGDFYPDAEPAYRRGNFTLSRAQMRNIYEIANIASCNLSYVIPTKCERQMATTTYADSVVRLTDGSFFLRDHWCVISPRGREKLAAMFAWGNSFGENLRRELRQIVSNYQPDGFYLDNGAFVWCDYGRMTQWMAFDDDGRIYTNAGIACAMLLDELRTFAPSVHRNPGEFIQYFSGFRAQSHLTNSVDTQPFYVRTHRLIMGYKPIFVDHPDRITKERLFDALELGGLPWLANFKRDREALVREWAPAAIALARAGWQPITNAVIDNPSVRIERFGSGSNALFTVRNLADEPTTVTVRIRGRFPKLSDFHGRVQLNTRVDDEANVTIASFVIPADELVVLRAMPSKREVRRWRKLKFLMDAEPTSIVIVASAKPAMRHIARCIKGFVELQAELLSKDAHVEIVHSASRARFANRVIIFEAQVASISIPNPRTLMVGVADEWSTRELLCEYLDSVEMPLSNAPPEWRLAVPMPVE